MSDTATNIKNISLDELCNLVSPHPSVAINELVRRTKEMYNRLEHHNYKAKPEREPMPEPVEVWLHRVDGKLELADRFRPVYSCYGPYKIIPGMMSPDELRRSGLFVVPSDKEWRVCQETKVSGKPFDNGLYQTRFDTYTEAQWVATWTAKNNITSGPAAERTDDA